MHGCDGAQRSGALQRLGSLGAAAWCCAARRARNSMHAGVDTHLASMAAAFGTLAPSAGLELLLRLALALPTSSDSVPSGSLPKPHTRTPPCFCRVSRHNHGRGWAAAGPMLVSLSPSRPACVVVSRSVSFPRRLWPPRNRHEEAQDRRSPGQGLARSARDRLRMSLYARLTAARPYLSLPRPP